MAEPEGFDRDISYAGVKRFTLFVLGLMVVCMALMWGLTSLMKKELPKQDPAPPPLPAARENPLPPEPRLQPSPPKDLKTLRDREDAVLTGYAWVDKAKGEAQIPIDRAIEIAAEKGLPVRYGPKAADAQGVRGNEGGGAPSFEGKSPGERAAK
jgi:hypothetical protein